ncbi:MAG: hypothetical protein K2L66_05895 [Paramuribaculum sp.]|nr:hypothetical protein [Paramuribaculum sp.]
MMTDEEKDAIFSDPVALVAENERRKAACSGAYDPESGEGCCGERVELKRCFRRWLVPVEMMADPRLKSCRRVVEIERLRAEYDFEFWAWRCVEIADKQTGRMMRMKLNRPQRKLLGVMEGQRRGGMPVRVILLKSRQWGGSTLTQIYYAWLQTVVAEGLNSLICAQVLNTSGTIRRMYDRLLRNYPRELCDDEEQWRRLKKGLAASGDITATVM